MPKLDTSISNLEFTNNKITSGTPSTAWTDTQYASGQTIYEAYNTLNNSIKATHPVGSVICMSTNTNPSASLGGTWTLIDKEFKKTWINLTAADWTATNAKFNSGVLAVFGSMGMIRLDITPTAAVTDTTITMGKINLANYGFGDHYFTPQMSAQSDGGNCSVLYNFTTDGTVTFYDSLNVDGTHSYYNYSSYNIVLTNYIAWVPSAMPDNYCDKFYFKRTA